MLTILAAAGAAACTGSGTNVGLLGETTAPATAPASPSASPSMAGSPSPSAAASPSAAPRLVDPREDGLEVGFGEFAVTLEAEAIRPGEVTFVVHNGGKLVHGLEVESEDDGDHSGPGRGDDRFKIEARTFGPGETVRVTTNLQAGLYELECYVADHEDRGMKIMLEVSPDAPLVETKQAEAGKVEIAGFAFAPAEVSVAAGTKVEWTNTDPAVHTVTAKDGGFGSEQLQQGDTFSTTFTDAGTYAYFCAIHPAMEGTVTVKP